MCRLLLVRSDQPFPAAAELERFAAIAKNSREFQGHGWGCAWLEDGRWHHYKNIKPIWQDDLAPFNSTKLLVAHARSAFKDEGIVVENNMPFYDNRHVFIFNGELRGVRIAEEGRIGAEKIFNFIKRFDRGNMLAALTKGVKVIGSRTKYIRAMNIIMTDTEHVYVASLFNEAPDYFTLHHTYDGGKLIVASDPLAGTEQWQPLASGTVKEL